MSLVRFRPEAPYADLAHLVERNLAKVEVAGSSPVIRLRRYRRCRLFYFVFSFLLTAGLGEQTFRLGLYFDFVLTDGEFIRNRTDLDALPGGP